MNRYKVSVLLVLALCFCTELLNARPAEPTTPGKPTTPLKPIKLCVILGGSIIGLAANVIKAVIGPILAPLTGGTEKETVCQIQKVQLPNEMDKLEAMAEDVDC